MFFLLIYSIRCLRTIPITTRGLPITAKRVNWTVIGMVSRPLLFFCTLHFLNLVAMGECWAKGVVVTELMGIRHARLSRYLSRSGTLRSRAYPVSGRIIGDGSLPEWFSPRVF